MVREADRLLGAYKGLKLDRLDTVIIGNMEFIRCL